MRVLLKTWKKEKMLVTSIFSFSHVFNPSKKQIWVSCHSYFAVCICFQFGPVKIFIVWKRVKLKLTQSCQCTDCRHGYRKRQVAFQEVWVHVAAPTPGTAARNKYTQGYYFGIYVYTFSNGKCNLKERGKNLNDSIQCNQGVNTLTSILSSSFNHI